MVFRILAFNVFLPAARQIKPADLVIEESSVPSADLSEATQPDRKHRGPMDCSEEGMNGGPQESGGASMDDVLTVYESAAPAVDPAAGAEGTEPKESVNGEQQQQQQQQSGDSSTDGAVSYMERVGSRFADRPEVVGHFMKALEDINRHCSQGRKQKALDAVQRIVTLFRGQHNDLLMGLKPFLPFLPELAAQKVAAKEAQSDSGALDGDAELGPRESPALDQDSATAPASVPAASLCPPADLSRRVSLQPLRHEEAHSGPTRLASLYHRRPIAAINQPSAASGGPISVSTSFVGAAPAGRSAGPSTSDMELEETLP